VKSRAEALLRCVRKTPLLVPEADANRCAAGEIPRCRQNVCEDGPAFAVAAGNLKEAMVKKMMFPRLLLDGLDPSLQVLDFLKELPPGSLAIFHQPAS
jgi:hypothetical protein